MESTTTDGILIILTCKTMHIIITGVHMEMTEAIRSYAMEKMKTLEKYVSKDDTSGKLTVELSRTTTHHAHGDVFQAEGILHIRGKESTVRTTQDDLYKRSEERRVGKECRL